MDSLWKAVLDEIELEVSKGIFHAFFVKTHLVSLEDNVATIAASSFMTAEYVEKRYYGLIKRVLDKKVGSDVSLVFITQALPAQETKDAGPLFVKETIVPSRPARIRADYTFENLAVSESNQLAYTAAQAVAGSIGSKYNPLYLYGTVGVGKTHLMHAIANKVLEKNPAGVVLYMTTEEFTNEVVEAIRDKTTTQMRKKFRNVDLLLLDDVQFLSGKERVQEELFHTFNTLIDKQKQVALSSDRPPHEIKKLEARLASRFEGGLTVDVQPPDFELRTAILLIKSVKYGLELTMEQAQLVAERVLDARALEGALLRLSSEATALGSTEVPTGIVSKVLGEPRQKDRTAHPDTLIDAICAYYDIKPTQLKGTKREAFLVRPRHICMYLLKEELGLTFTEIGNLLGGRDHTTVMHGVEKVRAQVEDEGRVLEEISGIKERLQEEI